MSQKPKPVDSVQLIIELMGFFKSAAIVVGMTIIEWAKAKQAHAEDKQAVAESELNSVKVQNEIEKEHHGIPPSRIIRQFIDKRRKGPGA